MTLILDALVFLGVSVSSFRYDMNLKHVYVHKYTVISTTDYLTCIISVSLTNKVTAILRKRISRRKCAHFI